MCEFDPLHCDCHSWAQPKPNMKAAREALAKARSARTDSKQDEIAEGYRRIAQQYREMSAEMAALTRATKANDREAIRLAADKIKRRNR